jgi:hypothetical protein
MIYPYTGDLWLIYYTVLFQLNLILDRQFTMHVLLFSTTTSTICIKSASDSHGYGVIYNFICADQ